MRNDRNEKYQFFRAPGGGWVVSEDFTKIPNFKILTKKLRHGSYIPCGL
jgi:hypothetical protein